MRNVMAALLTVLLTGTLAEAGAPMVGVLLPPQILIGLGVLVAVLLAISALRR